MTCITGGRSAELEAALSAAFRTYFVDYEQTRRWSLDRAGACTPGDAAMPADVVEAVEAVYLTKAYARDVSARVVPMVRASYGLAWFFLVRGFEETKQGLALNDWLLSSGHRDEEGINALERHVSERPWRMPDTDAIGMLVHTLAEERINWVCLKALRQRVEDIAGDTALAGLLGVIASDELAHFEYLLECLRMLARYSDKDVLGQVRRCCPEY